MSFQTCKPKSGIHLKNGVLYSINAMLVLCILTINANNATLQLQICKSRFVNCSFSSV